MNRAIDKPDEHVQVSDSDGGPIGIRWQRDEPGTMKLDSTAIEIEAHEPESED